MCISFSSIKSSSYKRSWILWLHDKPMIVMKTCVQNDKVVSRCTNRSYWSSIIFKTLRTTYEATCWKMNLLRLIENRIFAFSTAKRWLWSSLISNKLMSFIIVLRSSIEDLKRRLSIACSFSSRDVVVVLKCVKILKTVTVWIQIYTYRSADWSMILQSSLLFFYITSISWRFESHQVILWSHFFYHRDHIVWLISLSSIDFSSSIDSVNFRENHVIFVIFELSYSRIVNDSLNLIRRTR